MTTTQNKAIKYIICGCISAGLEFVAFLGLHQIVDIYVASVLSFACGLITSFLLNKFIVFKKKDKSKIELVQFVILGVVNSQLSSLMTTGLALITLPVIAKVTSIAFIACWNFVIMNFVIFKKNNEL